MAGGRGSSGKADRVRIRLLGGFELTVGSVRVGDHAFRLRKAKSLLKLLALAPDRRLHRARVGELLWPERDIDSVGNNLHQAIYVARRALEGAGRGAGACLVLHEDNLSLDGHGAWSVEVDVDAFRMAASRAREQRSVAGHAAALELYGGELLPEDGAEDWSRAQRQTLKELRVSLLLELSELHAAEGRRSAALQAAQQAVLDNPLHEGAQRALMRGFVADGRRQQALEQYTQLRDLLKKELEAKPDPETRRLHHEILNQPDEAAARTSDRGTAPALRGGAASHGTAPALRGGAASHGTAPALRGGAALPVTRPARPRPHGALPLALTSFIGRERECAAVAELLARARLVTLTGPGGSGKTRLALEVCAQSLHEVEDGVLLVELAPVTDSALVAHEVATALGIELRSEREPAAVVIEQIAERDMLLVLDNCEHVIASCAQLVQKLLRACSKLRVLATSREPLRVLGEVTWRVPSLALPDAREPLDLDELQASEAVRLFIERACSVAPNFRLTGENAAAIVQVCLRLDGMPLALELAAARVLALSPAQIAERLRDSFAVLGQGNRGALTRQQTLTATIGWSHDLLAAEERSLFRRLALFAGSFSLEAVECICAGDGLERGQIADLLARLVDKSLVQSGDDSGELRYRLLETVKQYAAERLLAAGERSALLGRFLGFFVRLAAENDPDLGCPAGFADRLEREHDVLRAALTYALAEDPRVALRLCAHLCAFWMARGYFAEGTRWLDDALAAAPAQNTLRARALLHRAGLAVRRGQLERYCTPGHESSAILRALDDRRALADALQQTAMVHCMIGEIAQCQQLLAASRELADGLADLSAIAAVRFCEGILAYAHAQYARAAALLREAHELFSRADAHATPVFPAHGFGLVVVEEAGRPRCYYEETFLTFRRVSTRGAAAWALANLSVALRSAGQLEQARAPLEQALALFGELDDTMGQAMALNLSGSLARSLRDFDGGRAQLERAVALRRELRDSRGTGMTLANFALLEAQAGERARAFQLLDQAQELYLRTEDSPGRTAVQMALGSIELAAGDWEAARTALEAGRALAVGQGSPRVAGWLSITLAEGALDQGHGQGASAYLSEARRWLASSNDARAEARIEQLAQTEPAAHVG